MQMTGRNSLLPITLGMIAVGFLLEGSFTFHLMFDYPAADSARNWATIGFLVLSSSAVPVFIHHWLALPAWKISGGVCAAAVCAALFLDYLFLATLGRIPLTVAVAVLIGFSLALYVVLAVYICESASKLTRWRGTKWVKEMEYIYLTVGLIGVVASLNRLDVMIGHLDARYELFGPLLLSSAIILRLLKTRSEIADWAQMSIAKIES